MFRKILLPLVIIILSFPFYFYHLGYNFKGYDEGVQLYASWRISNGDIPGKDFFFVYIPSIHFVIALFYKIFGVSIILPRILTIICVYLTGILLYKISFTTNRNLLLSSLAFLAYLVNIYTLIFGRQFRLLHYMVFLGFLGLFILEKAVRNKNNRLFFLSGLILAISALVKLQGFAFLLIGILALIFKKEKIKNLFFFILGFSTFLIPVLLLLGKYPFVWKMVIQFHLQQPQRYLVATTKDFFSSNIYLLILSLPLFLKLNLRKGFFEVLLFFYFWIFLSLPFFAGKIIWIQYYYPLIPAMSIFLPCSFNFFKKGIWKFLFFFLLLLYLSVEVKNDFYYLKSWKDFDYETLKIVKFIRKNTSNDDYVFSEILHLNVLAQRRCPPDLADISHTRIISGHLTTQELLNSLEKYKVKMVIFDVNPFRLQLLKNYQEFHEYLDTHYRFLGYAKRKYDILQIYLREE